MATVAARMRRHSEKTAREQWMERETTTSTGWGWSAVTLLTSDALAAAVVSRNRRADPPSAPLMHRPAALCRRWTLTSSRHWLSARAGSRSVSSTCTSRRWHLLPLRMLSAVAAHTLAAGRVRWSEGEARRRARPLWPRRPPPPPPPRLPSLALRPRHLPSPGTACMGLPARRSRRRRRGRRRLVDSTPSRAAVPLRPTRLLRSTASLLQ